VYFTLPKAAMICGQGWNSDYGEKRSTFSFPDMLQKVGKGRKVEQGTPLVFVDHELTQVTSAGCS
jgi:hypothetical protein